MALENRIVAVNDILNAIQTNDEDEICREAAAYIVTKFTFIEEADFPYWTEKARTLLSELKNGKPYTSGYSRVILANVLSQDEEKNRLTVECPDYESRADILSYWTNVPFVVDYGFGLLYDVNQSGKLTEEGSARLKLAYMNSAITLLASILHKELVEEE